MIDLSVRLLGSLKITKNGVAVPNLATIKSQALLAYLAAEAQQAHPRSLLANLLWPDHPERAALHNLRQALTTLRQTIDDRQAEPPFLLITRQTLQFNLASQSWLDCVEFTTLFQSANSPNTPIDQTIKALQQAIKLYQGDFLSGMAVPDSDIFEAWLITNREHYRREAAQILERLSAHFEDFDDYEPAISYTRQLTELAPWQESAHQRLMRCLAAAGERNAALAHYETCRRILAEELAVEPAPETTALFLEIRNSQWPTTQQPQVVIPPSSASPAVALHHLPAQLTSFVGREADLMQLTEYLIDPACRLVTLVGPGGVGKTRLALQAAEQHRDDFADGVHFIALANISTTQLLPTAIGSVLQLSFTDQTAPQSQLLAYLQAKQILLVLDNFEHLTADLNLILGLLQTAPFLKLLITSRERLNLQAEWIFEVRGLSYPQDKAEALPLIEDDISQGLSHFSAFQLFIQRAKQGNPQFNLSADILANLMELCHLTEGLPLALELAAAQIRHYPLAEIVNDLQSNLDRLTIRQIDVPERHRNLRVLFDSTWKQLQETERELFKQLSVFSGNFSTDAAITVTGSPVDDLTNLVDKSILRQTMPGQYEIHPLLRQFGLEILQQDTDHYNATKDNHCAYYAKFLQQREDLLTWDGSQQAVAEVEQAVENIRVAWQWAVEKTKLVELRQAQTGLFRLYKSRGWLQEGAIVFLHAVETLIGPLETEPASLTDAASLQRQLVVDQPEALTANWLDFKIEMLLSLAYFADLIADYPRALSASLKAAGFATQEQNSVNKARSYLSWGKALWHRGRHKTAHNLFVQALKLARDNSDSRHEAQSLYHLGNLYRQRGRHIIAREHFKQALAIYRAEDNQPDEAKSLSQLGYIANSRGDYATAQNYLRRAIKIYQQIGDRHLEQEPLRFLGLVLQNLGLYEEAQAYFQQVVNTAQQFGNRSVTALALSDLGLNTWYLNKADQNNQNNEMAETYCRNALAIGLEIKDRYGEGYSIARLGRILADKDDLQAAAEAYRRAIYLRRKIGQENVAIVDLAELAWVTLKRGQTSQALNQINEILAWLEANDTTYFNDLPRAYWRCYQVLAASNDADDQIDLQIWGVLDAAYNVLQDRAGRMEDIPLRHNYLEQIDIHRHIISTWTTNQTKPYVENLPVP